MVFTMSTSTLEFNTTVSESIAVIENLIHNGRQSRMITERTTNHDYVSQNNGWGNGSGYKSE